MVQFAGTVNRPLVVMGDFNDIASSAEKFGGSGYAGQRVAKFVERWEACELMDAGAVGASFTWIRKVHGIVVLRERLDRVLVNVIALVHFPELKVVNLPCLCSDHHPMMFNSELCQVPCRQNRPFRFLAAWMVHGEFDTVFGNAWKDGVVLGDSVKRVSEVLRSWNENNFGDIFRRKRTLVARINGIQRSLRYLISDHLQQLEMELRHEFQDTLYQEELLWYQKSRSQWICDGERNTRFYHLSTMIGRNRNKIVGLNINGGWEMDPQAVKNHVVKFLRQFFDERGMVLLGNGYARFKPTLTEEDQSSLLMEVSEQEVWHCSQ